MQRSKNTNIELVLKATLRNNNSELLKTMMWEVLMEGFVLITDSVQM